MRKIALGLALLMFASPAWAGTITTKDAGGTTRTFDNITNSSTNFMAMMGVCDGAGSSRCAGVDANNNLGVVLAAETTKVIGTVRAASGGFASGSIASGAIVDLGAQADSAYAGSGSASAVSVLKGIYNAAIGALAAGTSRIGYTSDDPCDGVTAKSQVAFSNAADAILITGTSAKKTYLCSLVIITQAAEVINLVGGTGSVCATNKVALMGSTTDANGLSFAANGGLTIGTGRGTVAMTTVAADDMCLTLGGTSRVAGNAIYVQQ